MRGGLRISRLNCNLGLHDLWISEPSAATRGWPVAGWVPGRARVWRPGLDALTDRPAGPAAPGPAVATGRARGLRARTGGGSTAAVTATWQGSAATGRA